MLKVKHYRFTLIEIVITLTICAIVGGVFMHASARSVQEYRAKRAVAQVAREIALTKILARTYQIDFELHIFVENKRLILERSKSDHFSALAPLCKRWNFPLIYAMEFNGAPIEEITLHLRHTGWCDEKGILIFRGLREITCEI